MQKIIEIEPFLNRLREFEQQRLGCIVDDDMDFCENRNSIGDENEKHQTLIPSHPEFQRMSGF